MASAQTEGLAELLSSLKLHDKIADADAWCIAQGADEIADLDGEEDLTEELADHLALPRIKKNKLIAALKAAAGTTPVDVTDTPRPAQVPLPDGCEFLAFLTHSWVKDGLDRDTHSRVGKINDYLKSRGVVTWFDGDRMEGDFYSLDKSAGNKLVAPPR